MAGELPLIRMEQGATEMTVPSSCFVTLESGGYINVEDGGYISVGSVTTELADAALNPFGVHYLDGSSSGLYTLPDPKPGSYVLLFTAGLSTGKEAEIASTAAQFTRPNSTASTGLIFGSTDSTGATSAQFAFLVGLTTGLWHVVAKTTGCSYL